MQRLKRTLTLLFFLLPLSALGKGVYLTPEAFLAESFPVAQAQIKSLWLTDDIRENAQLMLNHAYPGMRIRYWHASHEGRLRTAWILNEVGKTRPITIGISIVDDRIEHVRILEFRESRGAEVRLSFFTQQFIGMALKPPNSELNKNIDGISGATLSVRAVKKTARFALYLHQLALADNVAAQNNLVVLP